MQENGVKQVVRRRIAPHLEGSSQGRTIFHLGSRRKHTLIRHLSLHHTLPKLRRRCESFGETLTSSWPFRANSTQLHKQHCRDRQFPTAETAIAPQIPRKSVTYVYIAQSVTGAFWSHLSRSAVTAKRTSVPATDIPHPCPAPLATADEKRRARRCRTTPLGRPPRTGGSASSPNPRRLLERSGRGNGLLSDGRALGSPPPPLALSAAGSSKTLSIWPAPSRTRRTQDHTAAIFAI